MRRFLLLGLSLALSGCLGALRFEVRAPSVAFAARGGATVVGDGGSDKLDAAGGVAVVESGDARGATVIEQGSADAGGAGLATASGSGVGASGSGSATGSGSGSATGSGSGSATGSGTGSGTATGSG